MARESTLLVYRGEDVAIPFVAYTADTGTTAEDITGWTLVFTVSEAKDSPSKLIQKTCSHVSDAAGTFAATLLNADTDIRPGLYFWDVYRTDSGSMRCIGFGGFKIQGTANRPAA